ncbi:MAG: hypothetical protein ACKVTZ_07845 [Bacteroidia bacterium]
MRTILFFFCFSLIVNAFAQNEGDLLTIRKQKIVTILTQANPIILLEEGISAEQTFAQALAVNDERVRSTFFEKESGKPYISEVFGIYTAKPSDYSAIPERYRNERCFRVEIYNYTLNLGTAIWVAPSSNVVLGVNYFPQTQPDIPPHLGKLATYIAENSPEVIEAYGEKPTNALMPNTKTALNRSRCERSLHLCVAPTFVKNDKALWAVVDLTELKLVGVRWTNVGITGLPATERKLQNEKIMTCYCEKENPLEKDGWKMNYMLTTSDGLRISDVYYQGKKILNDAKMVDWHVSYSKTEGFGYSDAIGCPEFSMAAVVAIEPPVILPLVNEVDTLGFVLEQTFSSEGWPSPCNYNYKQRYEFYKDGKFRVVIGSIGRGCGNDGMYRPVTRLAFAGNTHTFSEWKNNTWEKWSKEQWKLQTATTAYTAEGYQYKITDNEKNGFFIMPGTGQFGDGGRGDFAYMYVTKHHFDKDEGDSDLMTVGPCCNTDYRQGPEKFIEPTPESLENTGVVLWYVAQLKNDDTKGKEYCWAESVLENGKYVAKVYPCFSGPMFVPVKVEH